jgi:type VI secretion system secreted protein VgrG
VGRIEGSVEHPEQKFRLVEVAVMGLHIGILSVRDRDRFAAMSLLPIVAYELDLGDEHTWRPLRVWVSEALNQPYRAVIDVVCDVQSADTEALLGASALLSLTRGDHDVRRIYGIVEEINYLGFVEHRLAIRVHLVPAFALLRQRVDSRIWQGESVQDIVSEVLEAALPGYDRSFDLADVERGQGEREICVQYAESDLQFISRLLEDEGIVYEFVPDSDKRHEILTLRDANPQYAALLNVDDTDEFPIIVNQPAEAELESIQSLEWTRLLTSTAAAHNHHDWTHPKAPLSGSADGQDERGRVRRIYAHGGRRFLGDDMGERSQDLRAVQALTGKVARGTSNITGLRPGLKIKVSGHDREDLEREYLITEVVHTGAAPDIAGELGITGDHYANEFECVPADATIRPRHDTPRPRIYGPQTAIVTGEAGEEITTDEHGRIKIQFHWEQAPRYDDSSSCWVRCSQSWAGLNWGAQFIPRVGMEVVVEFLEGNPDRPLVTGCVYNGDNPPPFKLPDNKTQSGVMSQSSPGGGGFNALRFEDAKDNEQVNLRAQKNLVVEALNDAQRTIGHDEAREIGNDRHDKVGNDETREVGHDQQLKVVNDQSLEVGNLQQISIKGDRTEKIDGALEQEVVGTKTVKIGDKQAIDVGSDHTLVVGGAMTEKVGGTYTLKVSEDGSVSIIGDSAHTASNVLISADTKLELDAGGDAKLSAGGKLDMSATGNLSVGSQASTTVEGTSKVLIQCGGASIILESSGDIVLKGTNITLDAQGSLTTKGGSISNN